MRFDLADEMGLWNPGTADRILGHTVVLAIYCYRDDEPDPSEVKSLVGRVTAVNRMTSIKILLEGKHAGEMLTLPPETRSFRKGQLADYCLPSGETIRDPDFEATWCVCTTSRNGVGATWSVTVPAGRTVTMPPENEAREPLRLW